jgi:serine/threonine-protein kinase HipA
MSAGELMVLLGGMPVGQVTQSAQGRLRFTYADTWLRADERYPLSLSMPLQDVEHGHRVIEAFLWGLLPDNAAILQSWGRQFQVSARNPFALISQVGEDCAGAVQFVRPERTDLLVSGRRADIQWLKPEQIAERLAALRTNQGAWRQVGDPGQFSLAGAQPKTALLFQDGRWGVPSGRYPTTHIFKPPNARLDGFPENEHLCLELARALSLPAASSRVIRFGDELAIVIERYDRIRRPAGWLRVHQEDMCQALGVPPAKKYQSDGGLGARAIVELLRTHSGAPVEDVLTFVDSLVLNWLIGGTDAHAKNYSLLIAPHGRVRLAPLYDIASVLAYPQFDVHKVKLAMKVGGKYRLWDVHEREWRKLAEEARIEPDALTRRIVRMAAAIPDLITGIAGRAREEGLSHAVVGRLTKQISTRARLCLTQLSRRAGG